MIDFHVHAEYIGWNDLVLMNLSGIRCIIGNSYYPHQAKEITTKQYEDLYERLSVFDHWRCSVHDIKLYLAIGINPLAVPADYELFLQNLPKYFANNDKLIAIGEVGIDPRSITCPDTGMQASILKQEFDIAKTLNVPLIVHTPPVEVEDILKEGWKSASYLQLNNIVDRILEISADVGVKNVVVDHLNYPELIDRVLDSGLNVGITIQPWRGIYPADIPKLLKKIKYFDSSRIYVSSDSSCFNSDVLAVPKAARELAMAGFSAEDVQRVVYNNPQKLFAIQCSS